MPNVIGLVLASTVLTIIGTSPLEQVSPQPPEPLRPVAEQKFLEQDSDSDGVLSIAEVRTHDPEMTQADFDRYDVDRNKSLSQQEFAKFIEATTTPPASAPG